MRALAALCACSTLCGAVMFPGAADSGAKKESETETEDTETGVLNLSSVTENYSECNKFLRRILSCVVGRPLAFSPNLTLFLMVMLGDFLATMSLFIPYILLPDLAMERGISSENAAFLISAAGISSTAGRILAGLLSDQKILHPMSLTLVATLSAAIAVFLIPSCILYWQFVLLTAVFGLMTGCWVASETPIIIRTLSFELLTPAFGLLTAGGGLAALTGPPLAGYIVDMSRRGHGNKGVSMFICGGIMSCSATAYFLATCVRKRREHRARRGLYEQIG